MRKIVFVDYRISAAAVESLERRGFYTVTLPPYARLGAAVNAHTDMLLLKIGRDYFAYADYVERAPHVFDELYASGDVRIHFVEGDVADRYPRDCGLNVLVMGNDAFFNPKAINPYVLDFLHSGGYTLHGVRQGYPACTTLKLDLENAITSDAGMARALTAAGKHVTLIDSGNILLPPHKYGFIGGTAGITDGTVYFSGKIEAHPCFSQIEAAIQISGLKYISLTDEPLLDVGGLLFTD